MPSLMFIKNVRKIGLDFWGGVEGETGFGEEELSPSTCFDFKKAKALKNT